MFLWRRNALRVGPTVSAFEFRFSGFGFPATRPGPGSCCSVRARTEVRGAIEYAPSTLNRPDVDGHFELGHIELPPKHAAIFVKEVAPDGHASAVPVVRVGEGGAGPSGGTEPGNGGGCGVALCLFVYDPGPCDRTRAVFLG